MTQTRPLIAALAAASVALVAWPAAAEINPGEQEGLGLTASDVPELLKKVKSDPYAPATCEAAYQELAQLDQILGPDADEPDVQKTNAAELLVKGARTLIPYRGVFRILTGVDRKERELADAAMAGWARRGFLKAKLHQCDEGDAQTIAAAEPYGLPASAVTPAAVDQGALPPTPPEPAAIAAEPQPLPPLASGAETIAAADGLVNP